jgi:hypothetical protein
MQAQRNLKEGKKEKRGKISGLENGWCGVCVFGKRAANEPPGREREL